MRANASVKQEHLDELKKFGLDLDRSLALAYVALEETLLNIEHQIMTLEVRRKRLKEEFEAMKNERQAAISNKTIS